MKTVYRKWLAKKLQELRNSQMVTQDDVAELIGMKRKTYANYEADRAEPRIEIIQKITLATWT